MKLREIAYCHYLPEKRCRRRANTCDGYESALRLHVIPRFGDLELDEIAHEDIQRWVDEFDLPGAAEKAYKTLRQVIRWAIRRFGVRIWDPTQGIELPEKKRVEPSTLSAEEVSVCLKGFHGDQFEPTVILSSCLGLRPGEAYGIMWRDIDMRSGAVRIQRTLQEVGGLLHVYPPKTIRSYRTVYLPRFAAVRLKAIWAQRGKPKGRVIDNSKPSQVARAIKSRMKRLSLPICSMYGWRHTWATVAVEAGAGIEAAAMMLGYSDISTTYRYYLRSRKDICQSVQRCFEKRLLRAQ